MSLHEKNLVIEKLSKLGITYSNINSNLTFHINHIGNTDREETSCNNCSVIDLQLKQEVDAL